LIREGARLRLAAVIERLKAAVRDVEDFPKKGIVFKDITPVLADGELFRGAIGLLIESAGGVRVDKVVGIDARGFIFAAAVADRLGVGFVPIRKKGKLPWRCQEAAYALEYGEAVVEIHEDAVKPGEKVLLVDDLLATGGTAAAAIKLLDALGADLVGASFLIELKFLAGREKLFPHTVTSLLSY
jgi:adenine phosphoribosyltransferase